MLDYVERMRDETTTPFDRMRMELSQTPWWHFRKRKHLKECISKITDLIFRVSEGTIAK